MLSQNSKVKDFNIVICHNNPLTSIGGTELYVKQKNEYYYLTKKIHSLTIFINKLKKEDRKSSGIKYSFGINLDSDNIFNDISIEDLEKFLFKFTKENSIKNIFYENFYNWINYKKSLDLIFNITKNITANKVFYIHDTLFRCPKTLLYVNDSYCGAANKDFSIFNCFKCSNGGLKVVTNKKIFVKFLQISDQIVFPSDYIKNLFLDYFKKNNFSHKIQVIEHLKKIDLKIKSNSKDVGKKIKIAFLGNNDKTKGFDDFIKLSQSKTLLEKYEFYVIGRKCDDENIVNITASYFDKSPESKTNSVIADILFKEKINLVFLFSKMPESYSYTMHESDSVNIPILTSKNSGNINYQIEQGNIYGESFSKIEDVENFLEKKEDVITFINNNKKDFISKIAPNLQKD